MIEDIRKAFVSHFLTSAFFPSAQVAHENARFNRPAKLPWAQLTFLPTTPSQAELGNDGLHRMDGVFQIDLNYPVNTGAGEVGAKYDQIRQAYRQAGTLTYSGQVVTIRSCGRSPGRLVDNAYRVSLTVYWYAYF